MISDKIKDLLKIKKCKAINPGLFYKCRAINYQGLFIHLLFS
ncbi:hypothetical protein BN3662_01086 [Clostridiales bacterium CHKCI006]|nr:hypothetical protein BN3662_01086 [Clostridiales bacterium CHKCI006]